MPPKVVPNFPEPLSEFELFNGAPPGKTDKPPLADKRVAPEGKPGCLNGVNFVISGIFPSLTRDSCKGLIEKYGGKVMSSLSGKTDVLVCGYTNVGPSKIQKAKDLNIQITDEDGLFSVIRSSISPPEPTSSPNTPDNSQKADNKADNHDNTSDADEKNADENDNQDLDLPSITNQEDLSDLLHLQELLYSETLDTNSLQSFLEELKNKYSTKDIDHQLILAFSLDYSRIPVLLPFLSKKSITKFDFIHADQEFIYHLIENNVSFPLHIIWEKCIELSRLYDQDYDFPSEPDAGSEPFLDHDGGVNYILYENTPVIPLEEKLYKKLEPAKFLEGDNDENDEIDDDDKIYHIRTKEEIENIIEEDDIERICIFTTSDPNFDYDRCITKENGLFFYSSIPILSYCIEKNAIKCFKYILLNGADPLKKTKVPIFSYEAEHYASRDNENDEYDEIWDAFGFAGAIGNIQFIKILQSNIGKITDDLIMGCTQFHKNNILSWVLKESPSIAQYGLINSIKYENIEAIKLLLENSDDLKINVNITDIYNRTPLHYASRAKLLPVVELLIEKNADINAVDILNNTPIHEAAKSDSFEIAKLFIDKKVDIEHTNECGKTPIVQTAQFNSKKVCKLLIDNGANVNVGNICPYDYQYSAIDFAAMNNSSDVAKLLLEANADFNGNQEGTPLPLENAAMYNAKETVEVLLKAGANPLDGDKSALERAEGFRKILTDLKEDNYDDNTPKKSWNSCFMFHFGTTEILNQKTRETFLNNLIKREDDIIKMMKATNPEEE